MRVLICIAMAGAVVTATPAHAQNNAAAANTAATNEAAPLNAMTSVPAGPVTPSGQKTTLPPTVTTANETGTTVVTVAKRAFPWGVLGLIGLIGLFGRKRSSS